MTYFYKDPLLILTKTKKEDVMVSVKPLHDRIIVKRMEQESKTPGGIIIPETAKEKSLKGEVIAVGKGRVNDEGKVLPLEVKKGDKVLFGKYAGTEFQMDGSEYLMMREEDIYGILN